VIGDVVGGVWVAGRERLMAAVTRSHRSYAFHALYPSPLFAYAYAYAYARYSLRLLSLSLHYVTHFSVSYSYYNLSYWYFLYRYS
jgi:hypothetical protein